MPSGMKKRQPTSFLALATSLQNSSASWPRPEGLASASFDAGVIEGECPFSGDEVVDAWELEACSVLLGRQPSGSSTALEPTESGAAGDCHDLPDQVADLSNRLTYTVQKG